MKLRRTHQEAPEAAASETAERPPPAPTLTRRELVAELARRRGYTNADADSLVRFIEDEVTDALVSGRAVTLGIIKLKPVTRPARRGRNPRTGEAITVPEKRVVKAQVLKRLADRVAAG